ncbi:MAG: response regulator [Lachnospiraceae bacterium]|nr:response regulator [Lachnospiraceae bacterium]
MKREKISKNRKKSIFSALFIPLFVIMIFQAVVFYATAVYGGIEETMNQNAVDILTERLINRKNDIETLFTQNWTKLNNCEDELDTLYERYHDTYGGMPFTAGTDCQVEFLSDAAPTLIRTLRTNGVNGVFLILNDQKEYSAFSEGSTEEKLGIGLRDLDQNSNYTTTEDLLVERAPSAVIKQLNSSLDSWWEARYSFSSEENGAFYYYPLKEAWKNQNVDSEDIAFFEGAHHISSSDQTVVSYSIPLMDEEGYPYGVLGVELTTGYLGTLLPNKELGPSNKSCYVLALENAETGECIPIVGNGSIFNRCFGNEGTFYTNNITPTGGFLVTGRESTLLYGNRAELDIYNNNNPFENMKLTLVALIEEKELFSYIANIKRTLAFVSLFSLLLGLCGLYLVSRRFSRPITALAQKVQTLPPRDGFTLGRLGIREIDQLVDSIEELNRNASRNIARTEFFSRMSHDMRTPMNAIISFSSQELLEGTDEDRKLEYLDKIHSSGEYLLGLINEVLDMTKIESDKIDLQYNPLPTSKLWETIIPIIDKLAQQKGIRFETDIAVDEAMVMVDEQHLSQIVMNLLSNAVKFTPKNGVVRLIVKGVTNQLNSQELQCQVIVTDTGIGMSKEFMQHMYHPFEQENEGKEGTGLGLSIAKKLIELMGGTIDCDSEKNVGTTFKLQFALQKCTKEQAEEAQKKLATAEKEVKKQQEISVLEGKRILVCEDHPLNTQIIVRVLERVGIIVETAENGKLGLDKFQAAEMGTYDAVLLDIRMPVMDGLETARRIRALDRPDAAVIPIIAMTANAFTEDVMASRAAGMNAHLSKPVEPQKLYKTLQELL